jgi:protein RecA
MTERTTRGLDDVEPALSSSAPAKPAKKAKKKASKKAPKKAPKPVKEKKPTKVVVPTALDYLKDLRSMKGVSEEDFAFFADPVAWASSVTEWIPTGSLAIDRLIGGGYPVGRAVEIAAWESVGKSTLIDQSIAMAQSLGHVCILIDTEQARDEKYTARLGVDLDKLIVHKAETIEDAFIGIDRALALQEAHFHKLAAKNLKPPVLMVFWDSLGGTPTRAEYKGGADDKHMTEAARNIRMNMRRLSQRIAQTRSVLVIANHFYETMAGGYGAKLKSYGGGGIRYHTSVRIWLSRISVLKAGANIVGHIIEAKLKKTKVNKPRPPAQLGLINGAGIHNAWTLFEWGKSHGVQEGHVWVQQQGQWYYLILPHGGYEVFQRSFLGFAEVLVAKPEVYAQMAAQYMAEDIATGIEIVAAGSEADDE